MRQFAVAFALAALIMTVSTPASGFVRIDWGPAISTLIRWLGSQFTASLTDLTARSFASLSANVQGELNRAAGTRIQAMAAIEDQRIQRELEEKVEETREELQQPITTCQTIESSGALPESMGAARQTAAGFTTGDSAAMLVTNRNAAQAPTRRLQATVQRYCDQGLAARGHCTSQSAVSNPLAGADMTAAYLFGSPSGEHLTFIDGQTDAARMYVSRITQQGAPEPLQDAAWEQTAQGKAYIEMTRRLAAVQSLSAHSLNTIAASHVRR